MLTSMGATEDDEWRRLIAAHGPADVAGRTTSIAAGASQGDGDRARLRRAAARLRPLARRAARRCAALVERGTLRRAAKLRPADHRAGLVGA